jgi:hypothetical protein
MTSTSSGLTTRVKLALSTRLSSRSRFALASAASDLPDVSQSSTLAMLTEARPQLPEPCKAKKVGRGM